MQILIFALALGGLYCLLTAHYPNPYPAAARALRVRAPKALTQTEVVVRAIAAQLVRFIDLDPMKRTSLAETLRSLGHTESPEQWQAQSLARALLLASACSVLILISPIIGVIAMVLVCVTVFAASGKKLGKEMQARRLRIERELPQFASTIRQCLNSSNDVVAILGSYRKVCGPALRGEIEQTLNDMLTGNPERAIKALESRVASAKLGQLTRGLIAVLRGDDQRLYFDMLSSEYRKSQNEEVAKALLKRPDQLLPYMGLLFGCFLAMICAGLGAYLVAQMGTFFN